MAEGQGGWRAPGGPQGQTDGNGEQKAGGEGEDTVTAGRGARATPAGPRQDPRAHRVSACTPTPKGAPVSSPPVMCVHDARERPLGVRTVGSLGWAPQKELGWAGPAGLRCQPQELWPGRTRETSPHQLAADPAPQTEDHRGRPASGLLRTHGRGRALAGFGPGKCQRTLLSRELQWCPCALQDPTGSTR